MCEARHEIDKLSHCSLAKFITLFPRIMVHALKYETEAIVHAPNASPF